MIDLTAGLGIAALGIAMAVILPGIGSAYGVGLVGRASTGMVADDPDKFGNLIILQALPGTQGIYGLLASFLMLNKLGLLGGTVPELDTASGVAFFAAALPIAIVGLISAIYQAKVAASGVRIIAKRPEESSKAIILSAMVETYAILALLITIMLNNGIPV